MMLILLALAQVVTVSPPPAVAPLPADQYAQSLKRACMSEAGIAIAVKSLQGRQEEAKANKLHYQAIERELGEAAYSVPIDIARLERAAIARNNYQAQLLAETIARNIAVLRQLSSDDRAIFARRLSVYKPNTVEKICN
jgi:hypothetical protein